MTLPADSTEIEKAWNALNYKNLDGLDDFDFFAAGYTAARASTIEECAKAIEEAAWLPEGGNSREMDVCQRGAAYLRALADQPIGG